MQEEMAMRASSLLVAGLAAAIVSIAPANAEIGKKSAAVSQTTYKAWNELTNYVDCKAFAKQYGWADWEGWYGCNTRRFKN
jgi:hypothetical protein